MNIEDYRKYMSSETMMGPNSIRILEELFGKCHLQFEEVDAEYEKAVSKGAVSVLAPETEPWGQRTCYIADPEGNLIEIGSFNKPFRS